MQGGKGSSQPDEPVKVVYVPYPYIPTAAGVGDIEIVSEDEGEPIGSFHTPVPSKHPSDAVKIVYVPVFTEGRSKSSAKSSAKSSDEKEIAYVQMPVPTKMPTKMSSTKPSVTPSAELSGMPSTSPTFAPSVIPTNERWCNLEYERGCRDSCFKERGCGADEACKKKCRKQCCSWD